MRHTTEKWCTSLSTDRFKFFDATSSTYELQKLVHPWGRNLKKPEQHQQFLKEEDDDERKKET